MLKGKKAVIFDLHNTLNLRPTLPLNPINPDNARTFRITAAAGTELAGPYCIRYMQKESRLPLYSLIKAVYNP